MKVEGRIFEAIAVFSFVMAVIYAVFAGEAVGIVALTLTGGLCLIVGTYLRFVARRIEERPEDNPQAEVSDGAGEFGFFSAGSYWPVILAGAAAFGGVAFAFFQVWLIVLAVIAILAAVAGLVFEYHSSPNETD